MLPSPPWTPWRILWKPWKIPWTHSLPQPPLPWPWLPASLPPLRAPASRGAPCAWRSSLTAPPPPVCRRRQPRAASAHSPLPRCRQQAWRAACVATCPQGARRRCARRGAARRRAIASLPRAAAARAPCPRSFPRRRLPYRRRRPCRRRRRRRRSGRRTSVAWLPGGPRERRRAAAACPTRTQTACPPCQPWRRSLYRQRTRYRRPRPRPRPRSYHRLRPCRRPRRACVCSSCRRSRDPAPFCPLSTLPPHHRRRRRWLRLPCAGRPSVSHHAPWPGQVYRPAASGCSRRSESPPPHRWGDSVALRCHRRERRRQETLL
mmetsp:Transcript_32003/g.51268  ORF Transcript_32003/g.51268 Transcript_32003/m.51268 type:complete len:319 (-) Transcript_32003:544-1500(-)